MMIAVSSCNRNALEARHSSYGNLAAVDVASLWMQKSVTRDKRAGLLCRCTLSRRKNTFMAPDSEMMAASGSLLPWLGMV